MPSDTELRAMYKRVCRHSVSIRRYSGTGAARAPTDYAGKGNVRLYGSKELVGSIVQGDHRAIVLAEDLEVAGFPFPLKISDRVMWQGLELAIIVPGTRSGLDGTLIAYEIQARG